MSADITPLITGILIFTASLISLKLGISVAIVELLLGAIAGNLGLKPEEWMLYLANFGGIILTFMAGTEIDLRVMKEKFTQSFLIGIFSFLIPFLGVFIFVYYVLHWKFNASLIAGLALSTTSLAVVYSVLIESKLADTELGKLLMASTFITDIGTVIALSIFFLKPSVYTLVFILVSILIIILATNFSHLIFDNPKLKNKVIEPEIKYVFLLLLIFIFFANLGDGHAILPAFILGLLMSKHFNGDTKEDSKTNLKTKPLFSPLFSKEKNLIKNRLRTVAYAIITPLFFIVGGLKISIPLILTSFGLFVILFFLKVITKFIGVYFFAKHFIPNGSMYLTLLMSTGLTFGTITSVYGLNSGFIDNVQYSVLVGVVVASAVIPTFIAQKWFMPVSEEDLVETEN